MLWQAPHMADQHGWIEDPESEPEEDPQEDPEPEPDSDPEQDTDREADIERLRDPESDVEDMADAPARVSVTDTVGRPAGDAEIVDPRHEEREMYDPTVPPSFRTYRHPNGGPLWKRTPRKSVRPCLKRKTPPPVDATEEPDRSRAPAHWRATLQECRARECPPSTFEVGESSRAPPAAPTTEAHTDPVTPDLTARVSALEGQTRVTEVMTSVAVDDVQELTGRVQTILEDQMLDEEAIHITRDELAETRDMVATLQAQVRDLTQRTAAAEAAAAAMAQDAHIRHQQFGVLVYILGSYFGLW